MESDWGRGGGTKGKERWNKWALTKKFVPRGGLPGAHTGDWGSLRGEWRSGLMEKKEVREVPRPEKKTGQTHR